MRLLMLIAAIRARLGKPKIESRRHKDIRMAPLHGNWCACSPLEWNCVCVSETFALLWHPETPSQPQHAFCLSTLADGHCHRVDNIGGLFNAQICLQQDHQEHSHRGRAGGGDLCAGSRDVQLQVARHD